MANRIDRRSFFSLNWDATVGFMKNLLATQIEPDRKFFRPPGAEDELQFLTSCTRCSLCKDVCPENIINLFSVNYGVKLAKTPFINPNKAPCSFCGKCIEACPTTALNEQTFKSTPQIGYAKIIKNACLAYNNTLCDFCIRACPTEGAIKLKNFKPVINTNVCNGCGYCIQNCINENLSIYVVPNDINTVKK